MFLPRSSMFEYISEGRFWVIVECGCVDTNGYGYNGEVVAHGSVLSSHCFVFPGYATEAFWRLVESVDTSEEALVRCLRLAVGYGDDVGRNAIFSTIVHRTQHSNEYWATSVLKMHVVLPEERCALLSDLCADLYESLFRALVDTRRTFWEANFRHALQFERKHVYYAFMLREGRWRGQHIKQGSRIPRTLVMRLDQPLLRGSGDSYLLEIEDERAYGMLLAIETSDVLRFVMRLPAQLKEVVLLLFWEGRSEKDTAHILGITDRTVRNRRRTALQLLREALHLEEGYS